MFVNIKTFTILVSVCVLFACKDNNNVLSSEEKKQITDSVRKTLNEYYAAIKKDGPNAEFNYLDSSTDFYWVPPGFGSPLSHDSVSFILRKNAPLFSSIDNSWEQLMVHPLTNDFASYSGKIKSVTTDTSGKQSVSYLVETGILIKRKDGWKLLSGQTSIVNE